MPLATSARQAMAMATQPPVIDAVRVPPSAWSTSQSIQSVRGPRASRSTVLRSARPIRRWISTPRPSCLPLGDVARFAAEGRVREHRIFRGDPAAGNALFLHPARHPFLDGGGADHPRVPGGDEHRTGGVRRDAWGKGQGAELVVGAAVVSGHGRTLDGRHDRSGPGKRIAAWRRRGKPRLIIHPIGVAALSPAERHEDRHRRNPRHDLEPRSGLSIAWGWRWDLANRVTTTLTRGGRRDRSCRWHGRRRHAFFERAGRKPFAFPCEITGDVPMSRGLGSSVTLRLGVVDGLNALAGKPLSRRQVFELCADLEGHPDNAAPGAVRRVHGRRRGRKRQRRCGFPSIRRCVSCLLIPDFEVRTADARRILPEEVSRRAAVASSARACRITAAFAARRYEFVARRLRGQRLSPTAPSAAGSVPAESVDGGRAAGRSRRIFERVRFDRRLPDVARNRRKWPPRCAAAGPARRAARSSPAPITAGRGWPDIHLKGRRPPDPDHAPLGRKPGAVCHRRDPGAPLRQTRVAAARSFCSRSRSCSRRWCSCGCGSTGSVTCATIRWAAW